MSQDVTQLPQDVTHYKFLCPEAGSSAEGTHLGNPCLLKIQVFVSGSRLPCLGNPFWEPLTQVLVSGSRLPCRGNPFLESQIKVFVSGAGAPAGGIHFGSPKYKFLCPEAGSPAGGAHIWHGHGWEIACVRNYRFHIFRFGSGVVRKCPRN